MIDYWNNDLQALLDSLNAIPEYKRNAKQRDARKTLLHIKWGKRVNVFPQYANGGHQVIV